MIQEFDLEENRNELSLLLKTLHITSDVVIQYDRNLRYTYINNSGSFYMGRLTSEIIGHTNQELLGKVGASTIEPHLRRVLEDKKPITVDHHIPLQGDIFICESTYTPLVGDDGTVHSILGICRDVTEIRIKQDKANALIMHSSKLASLGEMAGGIAHEINNPLAYIQLACTQMKRRLRENLTDQGFLLQLTDKIEGTVGRISSIVNGLQIFSREGSVDPYRLETVEQIIENSTSLCRETFKTKGIELVVKPINPSLSLFCRPAQISQILLILLTNSKDASEDALIKRIEVVVSKEQESILISVRDWGKGITEKNRKKIFQPFFTTKDVGKGMGINLSIARGIAESHNGSLELDPNDNATRFVLRLPTSTSKYIH